MSSEQTIRNHLPVAVALGIVNVLLRCATLPRLSGGMEEAGTSKRSPLPLRESRDRYARVVDRRARRVPRFATVNADVSAAPGATDGGGFRSERTTRSGPTGRERGRAAAGATSRNKTANSATTAARSRLK
jgi:hypothetical protein